MRVWELRDHGEGDRMYDYRMGNREHEKSAKEAYECGYEDGYEEAMEEMMGERTNYRSSYRRGGMRRSR